VKIIEALNLLSHSEISSWIWCIDDKLKWKLQNLKRGDYESYKCHLLGMYNVIIPEIQIETKRVSYLDRRESSEQSRAEKIYVFVIENEH